MTDYSLLNTSNIHPVIPKIYGLLYKSSWYNIIRENAKARTLYIRFLIFQKVNSSLCKGKVRIGKEVQADKH
ncbi:MAG: hypothetical protein UZ08_BCD001001864 [Candidatus Parvibacillus calidus]|jgi:hypothetical protein|nr:MAG: hypothetical protein UZ08_BCD001001864 [Candidatus Parvibacillus calidus]